MGKPVTLDSDDVEVLLNAAAAARKIEDILSVVNRDPTMIRPQAKGVIGDALDRINRQRALAIRSQDDIARPPQDWNPGTEERATLNRLMAAGPQGLASHEVANFNTLRSYGLVVAGQVNEAVNWGDKTQSVQAQGFQRFKLTEAGVAWIKEHAHD